MAFIAYHWLHASGQRICFPLDVAQYEWSQATMDSSRKTYSTSKTEIWWSNSAGGEIGEMYSLDKTSYESQESDRTKHLLDKRLPALYETNWKHVSDFKCELNKQAVVPLVATTTTTLSTSHCQKIGHQLWPEQNSTD